MIEIIYEGLQLSEQLELIKDENKEQIGIQGNLLCPNYKCNSK